MKAWKVTCKEFPEMVTIYEAPTDTMARYRMVFNAKAAEYTLSYLDTRAVRAPEWDHLAGTAAARHRCLGWNDGTDSWGCLYNESK